MKTVTVCLPAHFAAYLINADKSSYTVEELTEIHALVSDETGLKVSACLSCGSESFFTNTFGETLEYVFRA